VKKMREKNVSLAARKTEREKFLRKRIPTPADNHPTPPKKGAKQPANKEKGQAKRLSGKTKKGKPKSNK